MPKQAGAPPPPLPAVTAVIDVVGMCSGGETRHGRAVDERDLEQRYRRLLWRNEGTGGGEDGDKVLDELRRLVLEFGLPENASARENDAVCSLRGLVWKALLRVGRIDAEEYIGLVLRGPSEGDVKIRKDSSRTLKTNEDFRDRVPEETLIRVLNAFVHCRGNQKDGYVQSMSVLLAPFLYVMPEPDAFTCFRTLVEVYIPEYVRRYAGVIRGCELLDECLGVSHPKLHGALKRHGLSAEVYAFSSVSSLNACVPPLADTLRLWDFELAFGVQWAVLFVWARMMIAAKSMLDVSETGSAPLVTREMERGFGISARKVIAEAVGLSKTLSDDQLQRLGVHPYQKPVPDLK